MSEALVEQLKAWIELDRFRKLLEHQAQYGSGDAWEAWKMNFRAALQKARRIDPHVLWLLMEGWQDEEWDWRPLWERNGRPRVIAVVLEAEKSDPGCTWEEEQIEGMWAVGNDLRETERELLHAVIDIGCWRRVVYGKALIGVGKVFFWVSEMTREFWGREYYTKEMQDAERKEDQDIARGL